MQKESVLICGKKQWIYYDKNKINKTLILFLHGGPGLVESPLLEKYSKPLFEDYLFVNWEQPGSGNSFYFFAKNKLTINQIVDNGLELCEYLCKKFNKTKIILIAHSWGTVLGILMCKANPNLFEKYIGIGQIGDWLKSENVSYHYVLNQLIKNNETKLANKLIKIGEPPYAKIKYLKFQRKYLLKLGGSFKFKTSYNHFFSALCKSKIYSFFGIIKILIGLETSLIALWDDCMQVNLIKQAPEIKVPIYILTGRFDFQVPFECSLEYFEKLKAPSKQWFWFEESAHYTLFEEPEKFNDLVKSIIEKVIFCSNIFFFIHNF